MRGYVPVVLNILALVATLAVNAMANILPINGQTTGQISDRFQVYFVPAGYVFSIWSVIYLTLAAYVVYQALQSQRSNPRLKKIDGLFLLSSAANSLWILLWHFEFFLATVLVMAVLLVVLIAIYQRLDVGRARVSLAERWFLHLPFSLYLAWITVATIANVTATLAYYRWDGWGIAPEMWAVIMILAGTAIALATSLPRRDVAFMLVIVWAFAGIGVKQATTPLVANTAWVLAGLVAVVAAGTLMLRVLRRSSATPAL